MAEALSQSDWKKTLLSKKVEASVQPLNLLEYSLPGPLRSVTNYLCQRTDLHSHIDIDGIESEWIETMELLEQDLQQLLHLSHPQFWTQVLHDSSIRRFLDSYLSRAPRCLEEWKRLPSQILDIHRRVHRLVFIVLLRLSTHKESKNHYFSPHEFGQIIYDCYVFDIPKIMDICLLYQSANEALIKKMVDNIFTSQPKYINDLKICIPTFTKVLDGIVAAIADINSRNNRIQSRSIEMIRTEVADLVLLLSDTMATLCSFLEVYPKAASILSENDFIRRLADMYESIFPTLYHRFAETNLNQISLVYNRLQSSQIQTITICRYIFTTCYLDPVVTSVNEDERQKTVNKFLQIIADVLANKRFIASYHGLFSIKDDLQRLHSSGNIDQSNVDYFSEAIAQVCQEVSFLCDSNKPAETEEVATGYVDNQIEDSVASVTDSQINVETAILRVRDILPHLGEGFVMASLDEYNGDVDKVIDAILEDQLSVSEDYVNSNSKPQLSERASVYDYDEFDVFHRDDVDISRIHRGKKNSYKSVDDFLNDTSVVEIMRRTGVFERFDEYDDEYDDTYDDAEVAVTADAVRHDDDLIQRRPFVTPRVLQNTRDAEDDESDNQESDTIHTTATSNAKTQAKPNKATDGNIANGSAHNNKRSGARQQSNRSGNDQRNNTNGNNNEVRDRRNKERHKSSRANHNRKFLSDRKHAKGFGGFPT
ncbi:Activating signal cointegrator 1 complex subunit 2 [Trichoplax sp. H2]|nr:Activating signal cointegrator 1 complex subunit 2 [Trichoplax sp. H2]|eukprot:RDD41743.1 Activating signal cointegrator 1 complex subunit 2 [Trichoplax sp. H2]